MMKISYRYPKKYLLTLWILLYPGIKLRDTSDRYFWLYGHILNFYLKTWPRKHLFWPFGGFFDKTSEKKWGREWEKKYMKAQKNTHTFFKHISKPPKNYRHMASILFSMWSTFSFLPQNWPQTPIFGHVFWGGLGHFGPFWALLKENELENGQNIVSRPNKIYSHPLNTSLSRDKT